MELIHRIPEPELMDDAARPRPTVEDPREKAEVLVGLALLLQDRGGSPAEVSGLLHQALELSEDLIPALDALSSLMITQGNSDSARVLLEDALTRLDQTPETGQLANRLGLIHEDQGQQQEAYTFLLEAHRRTPEDIVLRMALGMNRFRAARWRDALEQILATDPTLDDGPVSQLMRSSPVIGDLFTFALGDGYQQCRAKLLGLE